MQAKINNYKFWTTETRPDFLMGHYKKMLLDAGFHIRQETHEFFYPYGFTALFLLSESHLAIHTFPEENKTYIELSSCVDAPFQKFKELCKEDT